MIEAHELTKDFEDFRAVDAVTFTVRAGEVLALLGPNGAGKTTTVRMLTSILRPTAGWARIAGYDVARSPAEVRARVGVLTEHHGLYSRMRGREYLDFYGEVYGLAPAVRRRLSEQLLERFGLAEAADRRLGEYSKGMRQKLALIRAMLHDPLVLLLDEPTSAMDPHSAKLVRDCISDLRGEQRAIILCTHNLNEAEALADRIAIIRQGRIIAMGSPAGLKAQLLGSPVMELRTGQPLNGLTEDLSDLVEVVAAGDDWVRYRAAEPARTNPLIIRRLAQQAVPVITLAEVPRSLEDVYLQVVDS